MRRSLLIALTLFLSIHCFAQQQLAFPFQGGSKVMAQFFKDSLKVSEGIVLSKATGLVIFKFSADEKGNIKNMVIYYADDAILVPPAVEALKKSNRKWIIPDNEKLHDFILPFLIAFNASEKDNKDVQSAVHYFFAKRKPVVSRDQIPLNLTTLLPQIVINYDEGQ